MFQAAGDFGLGQKSLAGLRPIGLIVLNLLQRDAAIEFLIIGNKNFTQAAFGQSIQAGRNRLPAADGSALDALDS